MLCTARTAMFLKLYKQRNEFTIFSPFYGLEVSSCSFYVFLRLIKLFVCGSPMQKRGLKKDWKKSEDDTHLCQKITQVFSSY